MRNLFTIVWLIFINSNIYADWNVDGYYINNKNDSIKCTFIFKIGFLSTEPNYIAEQFKIDIIVNGNKKLTLIPDTAKAFVIKETSLRKFVSVKNDFGLPEGLFSSHKPYVFLEIVLEDYLKLYTGYYRASSSSMGANGTMTSYSYPSSKDYIQKGDYSIVELEWRNWKFRNQMCELLSDNPELVYKIRNKEYKYEDRVKLIRDYNDWKKQGSVIRNDTALYYVVDEKPTFQGKGLDDLNFYFKSKIKWPSDVGENDRIVFQGIVQKDGTISDLKMKGFKQKPELNQKFLEIAKSMTGWKPGINHGLPVRSVVTFIIMY